MFFPITNVISFFITESKDMQKEKLKFIRSPTTQRLALLTV